MPTAATFNVNNLFLRYRFGCTYPGNMSGKSATPDRRTATDRRKKPRSGTSTRRAAIAETLGYLPIYKSEMFEVFSPEQRELAARAIRQGGGKGKGPDVLCLQEVESLLALRRFNEVFPGGEYPYAVLVDSRDFRQIDVGILSKLPITRLTSHVDDPDPTDPKKFLFSRDCLEVDVELNKSGSKQVTFFINPFKGKLAKSKKEEADATAKRTRPAQGVMLKSGKGFGPAQTNLFRMDNDPARPVFFDIS